MTTQRPNPALWLYFQYGGRLPARHRDWVLHDATCRTWLPRVFVRTLVQLAPLFALVLLVLLQFGGGVPVALGALLLGVLVSLRFALANAVESVDSRLAKYGYPAGHGSAVRRQASAVANADEEARYRERWQRPNE